MRAFPACRLDLVSVALPFALLLAAGPLEAEAETSSFRPLRTCVDLRLQRRLEGSLVRLGHATAVKEGTLAVAFVDLRDRRRPRLAAVNGDAMCYAASLPKIAVLYGVFARIAEGAMALDRKTLQHMLRMIRSSSNHSAATLQRQVGLDYLTRLLQAPPHRLYDRRFGGGLWCGKEYAKAGRRLGDPLADHSHGATAIQVARFYYLLDRGRLVSGRYSRLMKLILANTRLHHKFARGLARHRPQARLFRKSGTWRDYHADSALVEDGPRAYIAVALAKHPGGGTWFEKIIVALDALIPVPSGSLPH